MDDVHWPAVRLEGEAHPILMTLMADTVDADTFSYLRIRPLETPRVSFALQEGSPVKHKLANQALAYEVELQECVGQDVPFSPSFFIHCGSAMVF